MRIQELRGRRKAASVTQYELATAIGKSQFYVSGAERGIFSPDNGMLAKMEAAVTEIAARKAVLDNAITEVAARVTRDFENRKIQRDAGR